MTEIGRRAHRKYVQPRFEETSLFLRYYARQERKRVDTLVSDFEQSGLGTRLTREDLIPHKTSDTIFVLAGGASINQITDSQWAQIDEHDSIGLNRWPVHEFVPTYHAFELPGSGYNQMRQTFLELLEYRKEAYSETPTIIKDLDRTIDLVRDSGVESHMAGDLLLSRDTNFPNISPQLEPQRRLLRHLQSSGYFAPGRPLDLLYRERASITYLLHLSVLLGYQRIVLCGVDMVNSKYFFENEQYRERAVPTPKPGVTDTDETHPTNDPDRKHVTLENLIYAMNDLVLEPDGVDLYVENTLSALHPRIPVYLY